MKRILMILIPVLIALFMTFPSLSCAEEVINQTPDEDKIVIENVTEVPQPQIPIIDEKEPEKTNELIDNYNNQVDEYNAYVDEENKQRQEEYNQRVEEVETHNTEEQNKVEQNDKALQTQEKRENRILEDSKPKTAGTSSTDNIPTSWIENTDNPVTIKIDSSNATSDEEQYHAINLHIYVDENAGDTFVGTDVTNNTFNINIDSNNIILAEWECVKLNKSDIVTLYSQCKLFPNSGALFLRRLRGYTNGYWMPTQEFVSTAKYSEDSWDENGPNTVYSYADGTTDRQPIKNIFNLFVYNFLRYGAEPTVVEKYTPDFWELPAEVTYLEHLTKLDRLVIPEKTEGEVTPKEEQPTINDNTEEIVVPTNNPVNELPNPIVGNVPVINNIYPLNTTTTPKIAAPRVVVNNETPLVQRGDVVSPAKIKDDKTPLAKEETEKKVEHWALLNLILALINMIFVIKVPKDKDENEEENEEKENKEMKRHSNIIPIAIAIVGMLTFIFTENVRLPMAFVDNWTLLMAGISVAGLVSFIFTRDKAKDKEDKDIEE